MGFFLLRPALAAAKFIVFFPVRGLEFISFDDADYVSANPHVKAGLTFENIKWALTTGHAGNWHPATWLSHMLDVQLFGLNPAGHHLMNLLFHAANTVLLFYLFRNLTGALWRSAL